LLRLNLIAHSWTSPREYYNTRRLPIRAPRRIAEAVETWFAAHQRPLPWRRGYDPYHVWVSEVMLQQTRMEVVLRYFEPFMERFPNLASLANASDTQILASWSGLGYYRRARMLRDGARTVVGNFSGVVPREVVELTEIAGVGRYTAGAIASIAYGNRAPIVDGNVARILSRLAGIDEPLGSAALMRAAWSESERLVEACSSPRDFNQGLMELGALICKPRTPDCPSCPLRRHCFAYRNKRTESLPRKKIKAETRHMNVDLYIVSDRSGRILMRREGGALMNAMMHLPHGDTSLLTGTPLRVARAHLLSSFRHTITTRRIRFSVYSAELHSTLRDNGEYEWIDPARLADVPHPSYVAKALRGRWSQVAGVGGSLR
jgi:A/G-specific adenine glycosylase